MERDHCVESDSDADPVSNLALNGSLESTDEKIGDGSSDNDDSQSDEDISQSPPPPTAVKRKRGQPATKKGMSLPLWTRNL